MILPPRAGVVDRYDVLPALNEAAFAALVASFWCTCCACPTQYEGTLTDGRVFYFRYRSGRAELGVGASLDEAVENSWGTPSIGYGDQLAGSLDEAEFKTLFVLLADECLVRGVATAHD